jgi:transposase InsO family protein
MIAADYLKLPRGIGGFSKALVFVDFFTQYIWGVILKRSGTGAFSANALRTICLQWQAPRRWLSDGGSHFKGPEMSTLLKDFNIEHEVTPAYSPHCNGLIENENKQILAVLGKECAADLPGQAVAITSSWPKFWPKVLSLVNEQKTPVLNTSPKLIMFGTIDGSFDIDNLIELDFDLGTRFAFLKADRDVTREHMRELQ